MIDTATRQVEGAGRSTEQWLRTARLVSGLVLMIFVVLHFVNHSLALISLEVAEAGRVWFIALWRNPVGTVLLYGSLLTHIVLSMVALYRRRTLKMPAREAAQVVVGLVIPLLIAEHLIGTRLYNELTGVRATYEFVANSLWVWKPDVGLRQAFAVVAVWVHGCLGLYFWLRYRTWFSRAAGPLLVLATLLPVLALLGFVNAGRTVEYMEYTGDRGIDPAVIAAAQRLISQIALGVYGIYAGALAFVLFLRVLRARRERRDLIEVRYADGRSIRVPKGHSVLEASRLAGIPHHAVCGGRGRCSTCRVKVLEGLNDLPAVGPVEEATLQRIHADPDIRLACQLRPTADVKVVPLLIANLALADVSGGGVLTPGREQEVAVLFCDIRSFTALSDRRLPFDTVFLLNRYFAVVGSVVERTGGRLDKFIGDGAMAIFGLNVSKAEACRQALEAAAGILADLNRVSDELSAELREPLRVAIGIHAGPAIVGTMGYRHARGVTVIGDTVNIASRLESVAKELDGAIVVSASAAELSGIAMSDYELRTVEIRGRARPLRIRVVPQGTTLDVTPAPVALSA